MKSKFIIFMYHTTFCFEVQIHYACIIQKETKNIGPKSLKKINSDIIIKWGYVRDSVLSETKINSKKLFLIVWTGQN